MSFEIETERLILRDVREDDVETLVEQFAEREARGNILALQAGRDYNRRQLEIAMAWARQARREYYKLAVELKAGGDLIGCATLAKVQADSFSTNIGWHYAHRFGNNGYATEAARALLQIGFETGKVSAIYADCFEGNHASIRVMEKIGMFPAWNFGLMNTLRGLTYGEFKPTVRFTVSKHQWAANVGRGD